MLPDLDKYGTKVSTLLTHMTAVTLIENCDNLLLIPTAQNTLLEHKISEIHISPHQLNLRDQFAIFKYASRTDFRLKTPSVSLYLLSWTTC